MKHFDVAVVGGGPAGSTCARRLALLGHEVVLFHSPRKEAHSESRWESLSPGAAELLSRHHGEFRTKALGESLRGKVHLRWSQSDIAIAQASDNSRSTALIERGEFDRTLRASAASAGVEIQEMNAKATTRCGNPPGNWTVQAAAVSNSTGRFSCRVLIDASGRRSVLPGQKEVLGAPLFAIHARITTNRILLGDTHLEAGPDCWIWAAGIARDEAVVTVFVDHETLVVSGRAGLGRAFEKRLSNTSLFGSASWALASPLLVRDATMRSTSDIITTDSLKIGDAALTLDPLSSQGLQHALNSAAQAATMVHTLLRRPEQIALVQRFCRDRHQEAIKCHVASCADFYARQNLFAATFWENRRSLAQPTSFYEQDTPPMTRMTNLGVRITMNPAAEWHSAPVIRSDFVEEMAVLHHPAIERPIGFVENIPLFDLLTELQGEPTGITLVSCWVQRHRLDQLRALRIFSLLIHYGVLCEPDTKTGNPPGSRDPQRTVTHQNEQKGCQFGQWNGNVVRHKHGARYFQHPW